MCFNMDSSRFVQTLFDIFFSYNSFSDFLCKSRLESAKLYSFLVKQLWTVPVRNCGDVF